MDSTTAEAHSRSLIRRTKYKIKTPPKLCIVPVEICSHSNDSESVSKFVASQKLRQQAILEFLRYKNIHCSVAIHLWADKPKVQDQAPSQNNKLLQQQDDVSAGRVKPIDHLIFFFQGEDGKPKEFSSDNILSLTDTVKATRKGGSEKLTCSAITKDATALQAGDEGYLKKLELMISSGLEKTILPNTVRSSSSESLALKDAITHGCPTHLMVRAYAKLATADLMHIDVDLVPGLQNGTNLADVVLDTFGRATPDYGSMKHVAMTRSLLVGLKVKRVYPLECQKQEHQADYVKGEDFDSDKENKLHSSSPPAKVQLNRTQPEHRDNPVKEFSFSVQDIQTASSVPHFKRGKQKYSVAKYFRDVIGKPIEHSNLPLARIGKDAWVPLEMLSTDGIQKIPAIGHVSEMIQDQVDHYVTMDKGNDPSRDLVLEIKHSIPKEIPVAKLASNLQNSSLRTARAPARADNSGAPIRKALLASLEDDAQSFGVIYVASKTTLGADSLSYASKVEELLRDHHRAAGDDKIINIDVNFEPLFSVITDTKALLPLSSPTIEPDALQRFYDKRPKNILAVIDEDKRSRGEVLDIRAALQKFGNRRIGAVVHCVGRAALKESSDPNVLLRGRMPKGVLQAFRFMHGHLNLESFVSGFNFEGKPVVVLGAHVSHPPSSSASNCPSVASVVGSTDSSASFYPGSARLQPSVRVDEDTKISQQFQILDLEAMVTERLQAWKTSMASETCPHVIFYRQIDAGQDGPVRAAEMQDIASALEAVWPQTSISFAYIAARKDKMSVQAGSNQFRPHNDDTTKPGRKLKYFVTHQGPPHDMSLYQKLTEQLNASSQLDARAEVARALPILYAEKLARHMFHYFRWVVTNKYDSIPSVARRFRNLERAESATVATKMIKDYLFQPDTKKKATGKDQNGTHIESANDESNSNSPARMHPWDARLDKTMFYL